MAGCVGMPRNNCQSLLVQQYRASSSCQADGMQKACTLCSPGLSCEAQQMLSHKFNRNQFQEAQCQQLEK
eukprot:scaffold113429_cov18-Tisochrysis_lutea.AAC.1